MPTYRWKNKKTEEEIDVLCSIGDRDIPPDESGEWFRPVVAANFTRVSYVDGQKRDDSNAYERLKIASQLEIDKASATDKNERARLANEIHKLTKV